MVDKITQEIERVYALLIKTEPATPNYRTLLDNFIALRSLAESYSPKSYNLTIPIKEAQQVVFGDDSYTKPTPVFNDSAEIIGKPYFRPEEKVEIPKPKKTKVVPVVEAPQVEEPKDEEATTHEAPSDIEYTKELLREKLTACSVAGKDIKKVLNNLGAVKLSDLDESKYKECYDIAVAIMEEGGK